MLRALSPSVAPGAKPAPFPGFLEPCHPTLRQEPPSGGSWVHEIKFDGYRTQAYLRNGEPAIYTRRGYDWTLRFRSIDAVAALPAKDLILDGEAASSIRAASQILGCCTPTSQGVARTGCSTTDDLDIPAPRE